MNPVVSVPDPDPEATSLVARLSGPQAMLGVDDSVVSDHGTRRKLEACDWSGHGNASRNGGRAPGPRDVVSGDRGEDRWNNSCDGNKWAGG